MNGLVLSRAAVYGICLLAAIASFFGVAEIDVATGWVQIKGFNIYELIGPASGTLSSALALLALTKGWKTRK